MRRFPVRGTAATAALLLTLVACGGGGDEPSAADMRKELSSNFSAAGLTKEQADCYADLIIEEAGVDTLKDIDLSAETPPAEIQDAVAAATARSVDECGLPDGS